MIWRLRYCNSKGIEARIDIIKGDSTPVEIVGGSGNPFALSYRLDKNDKSGHIMTSSADIEIYETETFNIDDLKTSNETELKVEYFEENILTWSGFILPDFFSKEIGSPNIVRMTASDRLTALKGVTLSDLPSKVSLRDLIELSLAQTGLTLNLASQININQGSTNILDSEVLSQRLTDVRGRSISCYDILMSIMVATNSTIRQRKGQWQVYNKLEHELRTPTIFFDKVERGAIRTIQPVASSVGVYQEHGGGQSYPDNYDFSNGLTSWTAVNGFDASIDNRQVIKYYYSGGRYMPAYGEVGDSNYVINRYNNLFTDSSSPYLRSGIIGVIYPTEKSFNIEVEVNATNAMLAATNTVVDFAIIIEGNGNTLSMGDDGLFNEVVGGKPFIHRMLFPKAMPTGGGFINKAGTVNKKVRGLATSPDENFEGYTAHIRIYGSGGSYQSLIHSVTLAFSSTNDVPKGNLYKTTQGSNFTKQHDVETTIFGDYITNGLNGYFYNYPLDDTSNLYLPSGELSSPTWITVFDTTERPLLHHISRQKSRLFSVAHDILKANINVDSFDPLAVFQDCKGGKYVVVSASFDFLRSEVDVELEQIAYDNTILKRDFIYSYFGEGENNIKSIGGIAGGGGVSTDGGMTSEQLEMLTNLANWWKLDAENDAIYSEKSVYSLKGVSALGLGDSGEGGDDGSGDGSGTTVTWGNTANNYSPLTVGGVMKTVALSGHTHAISDVAGLQGVLDLKATQSEFNTHVGNNTIHITSDERFNWSLAYTQRHTHDNKSVIDALTQVHINVLNKLSLDAQGNVKVDATLWATGGISALGLGEGGGGSDSGVDMLQSWDTYTSGKADYYVPASLLVPFRNDTLSRLSSLESGSATSIVTTGSGNAITSLTKSGNVITANKGLSFALSSHTHTFASLTNKPTTISGYGITDSFRELKMVTNLDAVTTSGIYRQETPSSNFSYTTTLNLNSSDGRQQLTISRDGSGMKFRGVNSGSGTTGWTRWSEVYHTGNLSPVTTNTIQTITGAKTFTALLTASGGVKTPKVDFGNGFTVEPSSTELVFRYNGVIKQRMLSDGTILATGGVTALSGGTIGKT